MAVCLGLKRESPSPRQTEVSRSRSETARPDQKQIWSPIAVYKVRFRAWFGWDVAILLPGMWQ